MGAFEIVTVVVVSLLVVGIVAYLIYKKVKGQSVGCDCCSCKGCNGCSHCKPDKKEGAGADENQS